MSTMFPKNKIIKIFGEQLQWPGVGPDGKFTNGSFTDPLIKPSFIPAETLNLILENLQNVILAAGLTPNNIEPDQLIKAVQLLSGGRPPTQGIPSDSEVVDYGRDLLQVLGVSTIPEASAEIRRRCNNNGEIDNAGLPDFSGIKIGDYIDGIDLSGVSAAPAGTAPQAWNDTYKNNRIVVSGFNTWKGAGDIELTQNHILFTFRNVLCTGRMKSSDTSAGGYQGTEMREWLEGANGDGNGQLANKLKQQLGGDYLLKTRQLWMTSHQTAWEWANATLFPASESNVFGESIWQTVFNDGLKVHFPIYEYSLIYRVKRLNGVRHCWWECNPSGQYAFCLVNNYGYTFSYYYASVASGGVSPVFCLA